MLNVSFCTKLGFIAHIFIWLSHKLTGMFWELFALSIYELLHERSLGCLNWFWHQWSLLVLKSWLHCAHFLRWLLTFATIPKFSPVKRHQNRDRFKTDWNSWFLGKLWPPRRFTSCWTIFPSIVLCLTTMSWVSWFERQHFHCFMASGVMDVYTVSDFMSWDGGARVDQCYNG